ncbi:MAG: hypothetical protein IJF61_04470 [Clostridia bacterium]|nr:hypothetical protein [Clostridia bacterium]
MRYLNQKNYRYIPYMHNLSNGGAPEDRRNVATSGCGLCCMCMVVDRLTTQTLELAECARMSEESGANHMPGTRLHILGPVAAQRYGLTYAEADSLEDVRKTLRAGGCAVLFAGGNKGDRVGLFTQNPNGHYVLLLSVDEEDDFCILDPNYDSEKFFVEGVRDKVKVSVPYLYCKGEVLEQEVTDLAPPFYLFTKKKPE